ncbi:hypothetical protein POM88_000743 [Heracleum sosnowskyi]|uniref:Uncharacterized protein n=1 Tax=Heracleum sosnowskyi TaxID=360622 RepID=A0AAD8JC51_9APIA|nr:hypothetical protein POM88_000743 [Heracleum sosnowskyi]
MLPKVVLSKNLRLHQEYGRKQAWRRLSGIVANPYHFSSISSEAGCQWDGTYPARRFHKQFLAVTPGVFGTHQCRRDLINSSRIMADDNSTSSTPNQSNFHSSKNHDFGFKSFHISKLRINQAKFGSHQCRRDLINNSRIMADDNSTSSTPNQVGTNGVCLPSMCKLKLCWCCDGILFNCYREKSDCKRMC